MDTGGAKMISIAMRDNAAQQAVTEANGIDWSFVSNIGVINEIVEDVAQAACSA